MLYDFYGNPLVKTYDFSGNLLTSKKMLSLTDGTYQQTWDVRRNALESNARTVMTTMFNDGTNVSNPIYFVIATDQHSAVEYEAMRMMHNLDSDNRIKIINLGDCMPSYWVQSIADYVVSRTSQIENYISVVGNHDAHVSSDPVSSTELMRVFGSSADGTVYPDGRDTDYYSVFDHGREVEWLILCPYYMPEDGADRVNVNVGHKQMAWIIDRLTADESDTVVLMHQIFTDDNIHRDGTVQSWHDAPVVLKNMRLMLERYNARQSGSIVDSDGSTHVYDFSGCTHNVLLTMHGHAHEELYLVKNGLTTYVANWHRNFLITCGMIDRESNKVKLYPFDYQDIHEPLELDI